ncbi:hypothetical protein LCGC14_0462170 [marine sediment metagenome]|uniref:Uncharacterized protein n=1 Tax=marine sediment metagenome TaxID=412755 RepID=A0A0F9VNL3_9ZZZZ
MPPKNKNKKEKKEKTLEESLKDPIYVSYNIILKLNNLSTHLEEIKRINYGIFEILNALYQRVIEEETPKKPKKSTEKKEEREGTLPSKK